MSSWFNLTLDTTPPDVVIYAVENGNTLEVRVLPLETIDTGLYTCKVIDNGNAEYSITLGWNDVDLEMQGSIDISSFVNGINRIEVRLYDDVHNSKISTKDMNPVIIKRIIEWSGSSTLGSFLGRRPHTVIFKDWNGTVLDVQEVQNGEDAIPPTPSRVGHNFTGWDISFNNVTEDRIIIAQYTINTYTVTFKNYNGTILKEETVNYGNDATPPSNPSRTGYNFSGWSGDYTGVTSNVIITATYTVKSYKVTFKDWDGTTLKTQWVDYGNNASPPSSPSRSNYRFTGWSGDYIGVYSTETVTATYIRQYDVTFEDWDGTILKVDVVDSGGNASPPSNPSRTGYDFTGWSGSYTNVNGSKIVTATYSIKSYRIRYYDEFGDYYSTEYVQHGGNVPFERGMYPAETEVEWVVSTTVTAGWWFDCYCDNDITVRPKTV